MADHTLTDEDIGALKLALSRVLLEGKKASNRVDQATDDPSLYDQAHEIIAKERARAERLIEMLDSAYEVLVRMPD